MDMEKSIILGKWIKSLKYNIGSKNWLKKTPPNGGNWLTYICSNRYNEEQTLEFIRLLLNKTTSDINAVDDDGYNFIQNALYANYSQDFVTKLFKLARNHGDFNINYHNDAYGDTVIHTAIESDNYIGKVAPLMVIANEMGFDPNIKNDFNKTVLDTAKDPDSDYELDEDDLLAVINLIEEQQVKIRMKRHKDKLRLIQAELIEILKPLTEEEREMFIEEVRKGYSYKKK